MDEYFKQNPWHRQVRVKLTRIGKTYDLPFQELMAKAFGSKDHVDIRTRKRYDYTLLLNLRGLDDVPIPRKRDWMSGRATLKSFLVDNQLEGHSTAARRPLDDVAAPQPTKKTKQGTSEDVSDDRLQDSSDEVLAGNAYDAEDDTEDDPDAGSLASIRAEREARVRDSKRRVMRAVGKQTESEEEEGEEEERFEEEYKQYAWDEALGIFEYDPALRRFA
jgi:hypothetical protein